MNKILLITEKHEIDLVPKKENGEYILEGIFAEFGIKNNNNRIYEESDYLPHLQYLNEKIKSNNLLGELDHPEKFEVSLSNVSHIVEDLTYNKDKKNVTGRVRLLDTPAGKTAKQLIDGGVKLSISSRSAGIVESSNKVKLRQIFTYDLVANPGFENAKLSRVNESYGFDTSNDSNINLFDFSDKVSKELYEKINIEEKYINQNNKENEMNNYVTEDKLNEYSKHVSEEFKNLKDTINESNKNSTIEEKINKLVEFTDYLVDEISKEKSLNEELRNKLDDFVEYTNYLTESVNTEHENLKKYTNYLSENLTNSIKFSEHIAESATEQYDNTKKYSNYLAENLIKTIQYSEYIAENATSKEDLENKLNENKTTSVVSNNVNEDTSSIERKDRLSKINSSIEKLLESVKKQQKDPNEFMNLLTEGEKRDFLSMSDTKKTKVSNIISKSNEPLNESFVRDTINEIVKEVEEPNYIKWMPAETRTIWDGLDESTKAVYIKRANAYNLINEARVKNFWQIQNIKPIELIVESSTDQKLNSLGYSQDFLNAIKNTKF